MAKALSASKHVFKKGAWSKEEDHKLRAYIQRYGHWKWGLLPYFAGLSRSGKSCRLRWVNYLCPHVKYGNFTLGEDNIILDMHNKLGNK
ncbi:putative homeodomain-like protein [Tanacetum coccineum]